MSGSVSVAIVCRATLSREMLDAALRNASIAVVKSADSLLSLMKGEPFGANVGVYVDLDNGDGSSQRDADLALPLDVNNWIVMCDDNSQGLYRALVDRGRPACRVPMDISRESLGHLVSLAAHTHRICVGECGCGNQPSSRLVGAKLGRQHYQLLDHLADGLSNKEIARLESCTENTVKMRVRSLIAKLGVNNRTQAAVLAARAGITASDIIRVRQTQDC